MSQRFAPHEYGLGLVVMQFDIYRRDRGPRSSSKNAPYRDCHFARRSVKRTVSLAVIGLKGVRGRRFSIRANKNQNPQARTADSSDCFASGLKQNTRANQTPLIEWACLRPANIVKQHHPEGDWTFGREMGDIRTALEQFSNELVTSIRGRSVNHTTRHCDGTHRANRVCRSRIAQRIPIASPPWTASKKRVILLRNSNILTRGEFCVSSSSARKNLDNITQTAFICHSKCVRSIAMGDKYPTCDLPPDSIRNAHCIRMLIS